MLSILFPKICSGCAAVLLKTEKVICSQCRHDLPMIRHHATGSNAMKDLFYGKFPLEQATSLLKFQKRGITQELIHNLKYRGQKEISSFFGAWLGHELSEIEAYKGVDLVIPVPLHRKKQHKRGYNQVEGFGKNIAQALQIPYRDDILLKVSSTSSQVFKQRFLRFQSQSHGEAFSIRNTDAIYNKHILLVDDIVTTGATLENCAHQLLKNSDAKLSVATIAIA